MTARRLPALALLLAAAASAQHDHTAPTPGGDPTEVAETFVVDGLRLDLDDIPPGSAVGRAGLRYADGGYVGVVHGKPFVRGRVVFGGLVGYDRVWSAGAHQATELYTTVPLEVGGSRVEPGVYALFVTPRPHGWTLHVNRGVGQHLADEYDPALNVAEAVVVPDVLAVPDPAGAPVEGLTWSFADDGSALTLSWERYAGAFPIARLP